MSLVLMVLVFYGMNMNTQVEAAVRYVFEQ